MIKKKNLSTVTSMKNHLKQKVRWCDMQLLIGEKCCCQICNKRFITDVKLKRHELMHNKAGNCTGELQRVLVLS